MLKRELQTLALIFVMLLWPPLVGAVYLSVAPEELPLILQYLALAIIILPGAAALWWLCPIKWVWKAALTVPYVLMMFAVVVALAFGFGCARFGNCL